MYGDWTDGAARLQDASAAVLLSIRLIPPDSDKPVFLPLPERVLFLPVLQHDPRTMFRATMRLMLKEDFAGGTIYTGAHGEYHWLTSIEQYMGNLIQLCPDVVLGRYLAVTAIDSGSPWVTEAQRAAGWQLRSGIAYSQRVSSIEEMFYQRDGNDCPGYDEWYLFETPPRLLGTILSGNPFIEDNKPRPGRLLVFVGWTAFVLHDADLAAQSVNEMFWQQLDWIRPDVYISDGRDNLTFVCKQPLLFESVHGRLSAALKA